ncbi:MAG: endolytic transglycosylase MltG [Saprospiraceae bacterium]|nr:endolytic transglycosylase MltG [Saprospiraceae bacterium]
MSNRRKYFWLGIGLVTMVLLAGATYLSYRWIEGPNVTMTDEMAYLHIFEETDFKTLKNQLEDSAYVENLPSFSRVASWMKFKDSRIKPGRYALSNGMSNRSLINLLRSGRQSPVDITFNNVRDLGGLAAVITQKLLLDSATFHTHLLTDRASQTVDLEKESLLTIFIPNTYRIYWNTTAEELMQRMIAEHKKFWQSKNRSELANDLEMTPAEVYTLASIVEKETQANSERPIVAGLYLNRLERGIPLAADPTVVFAVGNFELRRVLNKHLAIDSPYNTYKYAGLPPGPIYMPSISSIDAVLNADDHDYLYMCARPDNSGRHAFAASIRAHSKNANAYRRWLDQRGIF